MKNFFLVLGLLFCLASVFEFSACRKTFITNPSGKLVDRDLQNSAYAGQMLLNGVYRLLRTFEGASNLSYNFGIPAMCLGADMMGADMAIVRRSWFVYFYNYRRVVDPNSNRAYDFWNRLYRIIANVNSVLDNSPKPRQKGQALALRAYAYMWLVNLFANYWKDKNTLMMPLSLQANHSINPAPLANAETIYQQIIQDLQNSIEAFRQTTEARQQKSQIDISVAHGLLARAYLYTENWQGAKDEATQALGGDFTGNDLMDSIEFKNGFNNSDNTEWLWGLATNLQQQTGISSFFSILDPTGKGYAGSSGNAFVCMSQKLYDTMQATDVRRQVICPPKKEANNEINLIDSADFAQLKFRDPNSTWLNAQNFINDREAGMVVSSFTGAFPLMRKAEMYLIAAEACCRLNNGGQTQILQKLQEKRGHKNSNGSICTLDSVLLERRKELWGEGFALFDLKRLHRPVNRNGDQVHIKATNINNNVLYVPANSDSLTLVIPSVEIIGNRAYNGKQPLFSRQ